MSLEVKKLSKSFAVSKGPFFRTTKTVLAVRDANFSVKAGQSLGILGESGSGKTTLAKVLAGFLRADQGTATLDGTDLLELPQSKRAETVQMVFQDPYSSLNPKLLLGTQL